VVGASWEGFVIENLLSLALASAQGYLCRTGGGTEIDLYLVFPGGRTWAVEIKRSLTPKPERGLKADNHFGRHFHGSGLRILANERTIKKLKLNMYQFFQKGMNSLFYATCISIRRSRRPRYSSKRGTAPEN
jgi:hypothetical protein